MTKSERHNQFIESHKKAMETLDELKTSLQKSLSANLSEQTKGRLEKLVAEVVVQQEQQLNFKKQFDKYFTGS